MANRTFPQVNLLPVTSKFTYTIDFRKYLAKIFFAKIKPNQPNILIKSPQNNNNLFGFNDLAQDKIKP